MWKFGELDATSEVHATRTDQPRLKSRARQPHSFTLQALAPLDERWEGEGDNERTVGVLPLRASQEPVMEPFTFASSSQLHIPVAVKVWVALMKQTVDQAMEN